MDTQQPDILGFVVLVGFVATIIYGILHAFR